MKAAVIHGPGKVSFDTVDDPGIKEERDIILQVIVTRVGCMEKTNGQPEVKLSATAIVS